MLRKEFIEDAKDFRKQLKWMSIICWIATLVFIFVPNNKENEDYSWIIITLGGAIFTVLYLSMDSKIKEFEKLNTEVENDEPHKENESKE